METIKRISKRKRQKKFEPATLDEVVGSASYKGPSKTVEEMTEAVDRMFAHRQKEIFKT